jgi:hypothetical protein
LASNSLWVTGTEEAGGFNFGMSSDIKAKLQGAVQGCKALDNQCYQDARSVLQAANVEVDTKLDKRNFGHLLSKTAKSGLATFIDFATNLYMSWRLKSQDMQGADSFMFIPVSKASEAVKLHTATNVVVSAAGAVVATITPAPDPTKLQGYEFCCVKD